jgi:preprotein translocase subunit SecG
MNLLIGIFTFVLILVSLFLVLVVLMQKAKSDGAVAALGSSGMESTFGAETGNVLSLFFVLSFGLYLAQIYQAKHRNEAASKLPTVTAPAATQPAAAPATPTPAPSEPKK